MGSFGSVIASIFLSLISSFQSSPPPTPAATPSGTPTSVVLQPVPAPTQTPVATNPSPTPSATSIPNPAVLVFGGQGTDASFLNCLMGLLSQAGLEPQQLDSSGLSSLTSGQLANFAALIFPEGNASTMASALTPSSTTAIQTATQTGGLNFLGLGSGALLGLGASANPYVAAIPVALNLLPGLSSGSAGGSSAGGSPFGALQNIFGLFANGQPALSQTPTANGGGVSVLMPSPSGGTLSCSQLPQIFSTGTGTTSGSAPSGQPISNPILTLIQQALNHA